MKIPLIFVHHNYKYYLKPVLEQARIFNKEADIHLLGNDANDRFKFVNHHQVGDYSEAADKFDTIYRHLSNNDFNYELFCFKRWFVINEFVKKNNIERFLCLDSDVLLFCNVAEVFGQYLDYDFTISDKHCPCYTLFSREVLDKFCDLIVRMYTDPLLIKELEDFYQLLLDGKSVNGVSDMIAFDMYRKLVSDNMLELTDIHDQKAFDEAIFIPAIYDTNAEGQKKVFMNGGQPYCVRKDNGEKVFMQGLHLQGDTKVDIYKYTVGKNKKRGLLYKSLLRVSPKYLSLIFKKYKMKKRKQKAQLQ